MVSFHLSSRERKPLPCTHELSPFTTYYILKDEQEENASQIGSLCVWEERESGASNDGSKANLLLGARYKMSASFLRLQLCLMAMKVKCLYIDWLSPPYLPQLDVLFVAIALLHDVARS